MADVTTETKPAKAFDPEAFAMNLAKAMESSPSVAKLKMSCRACALSPCAMAVSM